MNREVRAAVEALQTHRMDALEIFGTSWRDCGFRPYRPGRFPDYGNCQGPLDECLTWSLPNRHSSGYSGPECLRDAPSRRSPSDQHAVPAWPRNVQGPAVVVAEVRPTAHTVAPRISPHQFKREPTLSQKMLDSQLRSPRTIDGNVVHGEHSLRDEASFAVVVWALYRK
jgi:hypothetical protein